MNPAKILIVEDEYIIVKDIQMNLKNMGYSVSSIVSSGEEAIERIEKESPDLVLMDIMLKGKMDGIEAAELIRSRFGTPVVFLTAYADEERLKHAKLTLPFGYVLKPFRERELRIVIEMALYSAKIDSKRKQAEEALLESEERYKTIFNTVPTSIILIDKDGQIVDINPYHLVHISKGRASKEDFIGTNITTRQSVINADLTEIYRKVLLGKPFDLKDVYYPTLTRGTDGYLSVKGVPLYRDDKVIGAIITHEDVTDRKQAEEILEQEATWRRILVDQSRDGIVVIDQNGKVYEANQRYAKMLGYSMEEVHQLHVWDWDAQWSKGQLLEMIQAIDDKGDHFETRHRRKDGTIYDVEISSNGAIYQGQKLIFCVCRDITDRKQAEEALRRSEEKYYSLYNLLQLMCDNVPDMIWAKDLEKKYIFTNKAICEKLLNAKDTDEPIGRTDIYFAKRERAVHPENPNWHDFGEICADTDSIVMESKEPKRFDEFGNVKGKFLYLDVHKAPFWDEHGEMIGTVGCGRDVTKNKEIEEALQESEKRFKDLANLLPQPVWETDLEGNFTYTNRVGYESLGYTPKDLEEGMSLPDVIAPRDIERVVTDFSKTLRGIEFDNHEYTCLTKDGRKFPALIYSSPIIKDGKPSGVRGVTLDISELKQAEEQVKASLKEKEILLQEIHHRVKNNLAVISSLLSMQANIVKDRDVHLALQESQNRVKAMALIHETLYQSENFALVDLESYVKDLISRIVSAFDGIIGRTNFEIEIWDVKLEVSQALPCGLIINELATNALKHAFTDGQKGVVRISARYAEDKEVELTVSDNGIGFSEELNWKESKSLGLRLISLMVDQLHGTLDIRNHHGAEITIKWPCTLRNI